jgi:hypothetical protein
MPRPYGAPSNTHLKRQLPDAPDTITGELQRSDRLAPLVRDFERRALPGPPDVAPMLALERLGTRTGANDGPCAGSKGKAAWRRWWTQSCGRRPRASTQARISTLCGTDRYWGLSSPRRSVENGRSSSAENIEDCLRSITALAFCAVAQRAGIDRGSWRAWTARMSSTPRMSRRLRRFHSSTRHPRGHRGEDSP